MAQEQNGRKERARRALEVLAQALRRGEVVEEPEGDGMVLQVPGSPIPMATGRLEAWGKGEVLALEALLVVAAPGDREALSRLLWAHSAGRWLGAHLRILPALPLGYLVFLAQRTPLWTGKEEEVEALAAVFLEQVQAAMGLIRSVEEGESGEPLPAGIRA